VEVDRRPIKTPPGWAVSVQTSTANAPGTDRRELRVACRPQYARGIPRRKRRSAAGRYSHFAATKYKHNEVSPQLGPSHGRRRNRHSVIKRRASAGHCASKKFGIICGRVAHARGPDSRAERCAAQSSKESVCSLSTGGLLYSGRPPPRREQRPAGGAVPFERQSENLTRRKETPRARVHRNLCRGSAQSLGPRS
jgi:hypothetical protein